jgi:copper transport protein
MLAIAALLAGAGVSRPAPAAAQADTAATAATAVQPDSGDEDSEAEEVAEMGGTWADPDSPLSVAVRWAELLALLGMIGAPAFHLGVLRRVRPAPGMERVAERASYRAWRLALMAAALSVLTLLARLWLQSVALNGPDGAFAGEALRSLITGTVWGAGWALQAIATIAFCVGLVVSRAPHGRSVGWMGAAMAALLLAAVPALSGHASAVEGWTAAAIASDWLHVLGAGVWLGTLAVLVIAGLPAAANAPEGERTAAFARMVGAFSPLALAGAGLAGATGVVNSLFHLHAVPQLWGTAYGRMLLLKLALLAVVAGFGFWNWRYVQPVLHQPHGPARLRRSARLELAAGVAVILATAILVATPPP